MIGLSADNLGIPEDKNQNRSWGLGLSLSLPCQSLPVSPTPSLLLSLVPASGSLLRTFYMEAN